MLPKNIHMKGFLKNDKNFSEEDAFLQITDTHNPNSMSWSPVGGNRTLTPRLVSALFTTQSTCFCVRLTRMVVAVADYEDEQQHREERCKQHPADGCSDHSGVHVVARFRCNTSQLHTSDNTDGEFCS